MSEDTIARLLLVIVIVWLSTLGALLVQHARHLRMIERLWKWSEDTGGDDDDDDDSDWWKHPDDDRPPRRGRQREFTLDE